MTDFSESDLEIKIKDIIKNISPEMKSILEKIKKYHEILEISNKSRILHEKHKRIFKDND